MARLIWHTLIFFPSFIYWRLGSSVLLSLLFRQISVYLCVHLCARVRRWDRPQVTRKPVALTHRKSLRGVLTWSLFLAHTKDHLTVDNIVIPSGFPPCPYAVIAFQPPPRARKCPVKELRLSLPLWCHYQSDVKRLCCQWICCLWRHNKQRLHLPDRSITPPGTYLVGSPYLTSLRNTYLVLWWEVRNGAASARRTNGHITKIATTSKGNGSSWSKASIKAKTWLSRENEPRAVFFTAVLWGLHRYAKQGLLIRRQVYIWAR